MNQELLSMADVVRESLVPRHRIVYLLERGVVTEPKRIGNRRVFTRDQLETIKKVAAEGRRK
jgi:DNA-binding transcriptional MerR regulator